MPRLEASTQAARTHLLLHAPIPISVVEGPEHRYALVNDLYCAMVGRDDLVGKTYLEAFPELRGNAVVDVLDRAFQTGQPFVANEYPLDLDPDRTGIIERRYYRFNLEPLCDDRGVVYGLMTLAIDITEQVLARQQLEQAQAEQEALLERERRERAAVELNERQLKRLVESIPQLAWTADAEGNIDFYNQGWYSYTGTTPDQMQGWGWQSVHDPEDLPKVVELWRASLREGTQFEMEFRLRGADGVYRWFLTRAVPVSDASGAIVRWFGTNTNIDEQKQIRRALEAASRAKDDFLAMLSHELRNPLAPIVTALHLMRLRSPQQPPELAVIERQVSHLVRLVDDLLDVSRITMGKITLHRVPTELRVLVDRAVELSGPLLEEKSHRVEVDVAPGLIVAADDTRLTQVFSNLVSNAAKYSEPHGTVSIRATREGERVVVAVRDWGMGISSEMLPTVFEPFAQERQALDRSQGGLGLGLAIVRSLVALHGGTVTARSDGRGLGSTFEVILPIATSAVAAPVVPTGQPSAPAPGVGRRILIVDDNRDAADLMCEALDTLGYEVQAAYDGPSALALVKTFVPEVALLDIGLPVMDGCELARQLRRDPRLTAIRLVAVTGYGQSSDRLASEAAGFDVHLVKPIDLKLLLTELSALTVGGPCMGSSPG